MLFNPECCSYLKHEILTLLSSAIGIHTFFYKVVNAIKFSDSVKQFRRATGTLTHFYTRYSLSRSFRRRNKFPDSFCYFLSNQGVARTKLVFNVILLSQSLDYNCFIAAADRVRLRPQMQQSS